MTLRVIKGIEESKYVDAVEMDQILSDKSFMTKFYRGHRDAKKHKGKFVRKVPAGSAIKKRVRESVE